MNLKEAFKRFQDLSDTLCLLFSDMGYDVNGDLSVLNYKSSADDLFMVDQLQGILVDLECVLLRVQYLHRPIKAIGVCKINSRNRYELKGFELTAGSNIEYYDTEYGKWVLTGVEYANGDYYAVGCNDPLSNLFVRIR